MTPDTTVSVLCHSQLEHAARCIASVMGAGENVNFILTANGNPKAAKYFTALSERFANITVVVNEHNEGFWKPNNHALTLTDTRWLVLLNDDTVVPRGWLTALKKPFLNDPKAVFSCPDGGCSELRPDFMGQHGRKEYCEGACLMIDTAIAKKHGLFEPLPGAAYGEDSHASLRFRELGYTLHWVPLVIKHVRAATSRSMPEAKIWMELNHAFLRNRWAHYIKPTVRKFDYPIIVRRKHAWGDALLTTLIIRALKQQRPCSPIWVETNCLDVFKGNPHVARVAPVIPATPDALVIDLNMAYENKKETSIVEAYAQKAGITNYDNKTELFGLPEIPWNIDKSFIAVHVGPSSWRSKNWPIDRWRSLLNELGMKVVLVGHNDRSPLPSALDVRGITNLHQLAAVLAKCSLCISIDSLPLHVAQAVGTPVIGLFGVTDPKFIFTEGSQHIGVCGTTESFGMRHRQIGQIAVDDNCAAINSITVPMVMEAVAKMTKPEKAALAT